MEGETKMANKKTNVGPRFCSLGFAAVYLPRNKAIVHSMNGNAFIPQSGSSICFTSYCICINTLDSNP